MFSGLFARISGQGIRRYPVCKGFTARALRCPKYAGLRAPFSGVRNLDPAQGIGEDEQDRHRREVAQGGQPQGGQGGCGVAAFAHVPEDIGLLLIPPGKKGDAQGADGHDPRRDQVIPQIKDGLAEEGQLFPRAE